MMQICINVSYKLNPENIPYINLFMHMQNNQIAGSSLELQILSVVRNNYMAAGKPSRYSKKSEDWIIRS